MYRDYVGIRVIHKPPPFQGLNIRIPIMIPFKGSGIINEGSTLGSKLLSPNPKQ